MYHYIYTKKPIRNPERIQNRPALAALDIRYIYIFYKPKLSKLANRRHCVPPIISQEPNVFIRIESSIAQHQLKNLVPEKAQLSASLLFKISMKDREIAKRVH